MKLCLEELQLRNLNVLKKTICPSSCTVFVTRSAKQIAYTVIKFPQAIFLTDLRKFACFRTFRGKWACLVINTLKNRKFCTYGPTPHEGCALFYRWWDQNTLTPWPDTIGKNTWWIFFTSPFNDISNPLHCPFNDISNSNLEKYTNIQSLNFRTS